MFFSGDSYHTHHKYRNIYWDDDTKAQYSSMNFSDDVSGWIDLLEKTVDDAKIDPKLCKIVDKIGQTDWKEQDEAIAAQKQFEQERQGNESNAVQLQKLDELNGLNINPKQVGAALANRRRNNPRKRKQKLQSWD